MAWVFILSAEDNPVVVEFDATMSENHDKVTEVTTHPVESGADIADHVRSLPTAFSCEVYVSNTPIEAGQRGVLQNVRLDVPRFTPPLTSVGAIVDAATQLFTGPPPPIYVQTLTFPEAFDRVKEVYDALTDLSDRGVLLSVVSSLGTYENMALALLSVPRTELGGASFNLTFEPIRVVQTLLVEAPKPAEPRGAPKLNKGGQATKPVNAKDSEKGTSLLLQGLQGLGLVRP